MFEDFDYEDYFEPGVIDQIVIDAIAKAKEQVKEGIKINLEVELTKNQTEKERLSIAQGVLNGRIREVSKRERDVESKEKNMLKNFVKDFFKEENANIVKITYDSSLGEKCEHCDNDRKVELVDQFSRKHKVDCSCKIYVKTWKYDTPYKTSFVVRKDWSNLEKYTHIEFSGEDSYGYTFDAKKDKVFPSFEVFKGYIDGGGRPYGEYIIDEDVAKQCVDYLNSRNQQ